MKYIYLMFMFQDYKLSINVDIFGILGYFIKNGQNFIQILVTLPRQTCSIINKTTFVIKALGNEEGDTNM